MAAPGSIDSPLQAELEAVYAYYAALACHLNAESGLGGKLLYAGELDQDGARLVRAANVAGAASLSAASDASTQRSAIRDGVVDFVVTSLDEALRILKNEIRKRNGVSVAVTVPHPQLVDEMTERGVLPDLLRDSESAALFAAQGAQLVHASVMPAGHSLALFHSPSAEFEQRALALIPAGDQAARRWLRLSHRYLVPQARRIRSLPCDPSLAAELTRRLPLQSAPKAP
jgi:Urocanase Rossmann-like domain